MPTEAEAVAVNESGEATSETTWVIMVTFFCFSLLFGGELE